MSTAHFVVQLSWNWVGPYSPFDEPGVVLGAYGLMHLSALAQVNRATVIDIGVSNVFDRAFPELVAGRIVAPGEPRSTRAGVRYKM